MKKQVLILYEYLYRISSGNKRFKFKPKLNEEKIIDNFLSKLSPSYGEEWLFEFMCFQFSRYVDLETRFGKGIVMVGWILGDKAIKKFNDATDEERYWGYNFKTKFGVKNPCLDKLSAVTNTNYYDRERVRFKGNNDRQFIHCVEMKLYKDKNKVCMFCKNKKLCQ